jgi:AcrR family transcriptional regulator
MPPRRQPPDVRQAQILEAALAVCAEKGYHATRIDDVAERAGLSKGAVYHHFPSKQAVFIAVLDKMMEELIGALVAAEAAQAGVADTVRRMLVMTAGMTAQQSLAGAMFDLFVLAMRDDEFRARIRHHYNEAFVACTRLFQRGIDRGELREALDAEVAARSFLMALDGIILDHLVMDEVPQMATTIVAFGEHILGGLLRPEDGGQT